MFLIFFPCIAIIIEVGELSEPKNTSVKQYSITYTFKVARKISHADKYLICNFKSRLNKENI